MMKSSIKIVLAICVLILMNGPVYSQKMDDKTFSGLAFRNIGPAMTSGRIADIAIHPENENIWYVAVGSGGVWKTTNSGTTWQPATHQQKLDPESYIYTNGSLITGKPTLGAAITYPRDNSTIKMKVISDPIRHTINRAELAAITQALIINNNTTDLNILTDSAYCINSIRNFCHTPYRYKTNVHYQLLQIASNLLKEREQKGLKTKIGKLKSHTQSNLEN